MILSEITKTYAGLGEKIVFRVSPIDTLQNLEVGEQVYILFADAKPNSIRTAAARIRNKSFTITEKGYKDRTFIRRKA